jgi:hypothetical protein
MVRRLFRIFAHEGRIAWPVVIAFAFVNGLVLLNAVRHDPKFGYDASQHLAYVKVLSGGHLTTPEQSAEFFCPPLPYVPGAVMLAALSRFEGNDEAWKIAQLVQAFCAIVISYFVLKIGRLLDGGPFLLACSLLCLGLIPAYTRTFAMIRGEPMLVMFGVIGIYLTLKTFAINRPTVKAAALTGLVLGLAVLCRQWAFFLLPPLALVGLWRLIADKAERRTAMAAGFVTLATFGLVAAPFYAYLHHEYGSVRAFNRPAAGADDDETSDRYKPRDFRESVHFLVTEPLRHNFATQPGFLFYGDLWGDYWQYFVVYAQDAKGRFVPAGKVRQAYRARPRTPTNYGSIRAYLGRCAAAGIVPTAFMTAGLVGGLLAFRRLQWHRHSCLCSAQPKDTSGVPLDHRQDCLCHCLENASCLFCPLLALLVLSTAAGYVWFIASYPNRNFDTVKASYPLQAYPPLALLTASLLNAIHKRHPRVALTCVALLVIVAIHNVPAMITRYVD